MRKRSRFNALQPIEERCWLVITSMAGDLLRTQSLDPLTDLRRVLDTELDRLLANGWEVVEPHSTTAAVFFAQRGVERIGVAIVSLEPGTVQASR